jgi:hypothetical protein
MNHPKKFLLPCDHPKFQKLMCTIRKLFCALYTTPSTFTYKTITVSAVRWDHVAKDPPPNVLFSMEKAMMGAIQSPSAPPNREQLTSSHAVGDVAELVIRWPG